MNNSMKSMISLVMAPMLVLLKNESNTQRAIMYGIFSSSAIILFYCLLVVSAGKDAVIIYAIPLTLIGILPSILAMSYITYLFSGLSRSQLEFRKFVERAVGESKSESDVSETHQIAIVAMVALACMALMIGFMINAFYIFVIGIGFRIMIINFNTGLIVIGLGLLFLALVINNAKIRRAFDEVMRPIANRLHHA